ncbi:hypothetical protein R3P38DRAFT_2769081 [Favolaschia claudopus]|uniref:Uncharacterized protein n=1 Tax=Favolaschia claudopus TaxID=2862362 RepID=A0AAW0CLT5_9AGAR
MEFDKFFDKDAASTALENIIQAKTGHVKESNNPSVQYLRNFSADTAVVQEVNAHGRKCWRLGAIDDAGAVEHEISFRVHGILSKVDLVPGNISRCSMERVTNLCQRVELTGLDSASFSQSINQILVVQDAFRRFFAGQRVSAWNFSDEDGHARFNCTCLYLTKTDGRAVEEVPFGPGVDPLGQLAKFRSSDLVHTAENDVKYLRLAKQDLLHPREMFYEAFPAAFRKGDIVEVQGTIVAFFSKNGMVKTIFQMNVLTLLDATFSKAAELARSQAYKPTPPKQVLKRKVWYEEEDLEVHSTRRRFKDLRLEDFDNSRVSSHQSARDEMSRD